MANTIQTCQLVLQPFHPQLRHVVDEAWRRFLTIPAPLRIALTRPIARPTVMWAYMQEVAAETFTGVEGVQAITRFNVTNYLFGNDVLVRLKQLDETGLSRNYPTPRAVAFNSPQLDLPDISSSALRVDVGYNLNAVETAVERVLVSHRTGDDLDWCYELSPPDDGALPLPLPVMPVVPPTRWVARAEEGEQHDDRKQATDAE